MEGIGLKFSFRFAVEGEWDRSNVLRNYCQFSDFSENTPTLTEDGITLHEAANSRL